MSWDGFQFYRSITGNDNLEDYWSSEALEYIVSGFLAAAVAAVIGVVYVGYRLWTEIALEINYRQRYGANWQAEFERYHGSLAHAHSRLVIVFICLLVLLAVLLWYGSQFYKSHRRRRHRHVA